MNLRTRYPNQRFERLLRPDIRGMEPYIPIHPIEVLSKRLRIPVEKIIKLDANENPYGSLPGIAEVLAGLSYTHIYPDPESLALRHTIASYYGVTFRNILAGAGADELIDLVMRALLSPGDSIVNCPPTFGMYKFDAEVNHANVIPVPRRSDFSLDIDGIITAVSAERPKVLFLANPNNPDGSIITSEDLLRLLDLPIMVVIDEAYIDFARPRTTLVNHPKFKAYRQANLIVLRTFSKWAGLAGLRVGFGIFPDWLITHLWKIKQPYNVSVAASTAAIYSLENSDQLEDNTTRMIQEREKLFDSLQEIPWLTPYPSQANFILCKVVGLDAARLKNRLANQGILIRYFRHPGLSDHIRISIGLPEHNDRLLETIKSCRG